MAESTIECVAAAIAMKSEGWTKNAKDYIPHARAAIEAMRNGPTDVSGLVERLNVPWPEHEVEEVTLPAWILELCAEAATSLTALAAKVSEMEAENEWLWERVDELDKALDELADDDEPAGEIVIDAEFEYEDGIVIGTTSAPVKRVEQQDDGTFTVVIDYWPPTALKALPAPVVTDEMVDRAWARASEMSVGTAMANKSALREVLKAAIQETKNEGGKVE